MPDKLSHIPPNDDEIVPIDIEDRLARFGGVERASPDLIEKLSQPRGETAQPRRLMFEQAPGSSGEAYLNNIPAEASAGGPGHKEITYRSNASKAALIEEFLHGVQDDIGIQSRFGNEFAEWHVRDFMIRNQKLLRLTPDDVMRLDVDRQSLARRPDVQEHIANEAERKQQARADLELQRTEIRAAAEHHAGRAMGVAAVGVDLAQGNASAAAMDTAAVVAQTRTAQEIAVKAAAHVGLTTTFNRVMRAIPVVGSYMAYRSMQSEVDSFTEAKRPDLAEAAYQVGKAEVLGNVLGGWTADAAREATRAEYVRQGGRDYEQLAHAGSVQLAITTKDIVVGSDAEKPIAPPDGKPLAEVLPPNHASMAQGADAMGERSEISRIAVERTGLAASDPGNNMSVLMRDANRPTGHLLVLEDGRVQGPESGAVPFASNPQIAAGRNGGTLGILYAGTGAMNDAQWNTVSQVRDWLGQQRTAEGLPAQTELIAGSTATAQILNLPTPRGPLPETVAPQPGMAPTKARQALAHSTP